MYLAVAESWLHPGWLIGACPAPMPSSVGVATWLSPAKAFGGVGGAAELGFR